ncbi:MAG: hypothetical protein QOD29_4851 [Alphaproteobacteria bacterium]|jgi:hypothetical protein|nr:hypothetical protein [Alphaproteobacteria bacterium]
MEALRRSVAKDKKLTAPRRSAMTRRRASRVKAKRTKAAASCDSLYRFKQLAEAELNSDLKSLFSDPRHGNPTKLQG